MGNRLIGPEIINLQNDLHFRLLLPFDEWEINSQGNRPLAFLTCLKILLEALGILFSYQNRRYQYMVDQLLRFLYWKNFRNVFASRIPYYN